MYISRFDGNGKIENSPILSWGIHIDVPQCSMEDVNWVLCGTLKNQMIKMISSAIEAAEWFKGIWYVKDNGTLLRPFEHTSNGEGIEFKKVLLNPVDPHTNTSALSVFLKLQKKELDYRDEMLTMVTLSSSRRIMVDSKGFYILEAREEYKYGEIALP